MGQIRGVLATEDCDFCKGKGRVPGGKYQSQGEVINCPICHGKKYITKVITLDELRAFLTNQGDQDGKTSVQDQHSE